MAVGDFSGDGIEGKILVSVKKKNQKKIMVIRWAGLSNKWYRTNDQVHRKMYEALGLSYPVQAKAFCSGTWMLPACLSFYFRLCVRSPKSSKNTGHGRKFETFNFVINEKINVVGML